LALFLASDFALAFSFSMTCSGAWTTTNPAVSKPARPARPAIWRNSRVFRTRCRLPSNFASPVKRTVRIGTLMPTPRVSVPQMTVSRPAWARVSTRRRYFGSIPAWWTPIPAFTSFCSVLPKPAPNEGADLLGDGVLVLPVDPAQPPDAQQPGRVLDGVGLREVHDVRRGLAGRDELLDRLVEMFDGPPEAERDGSFGLVDHGGRPAGTPGQVRGDLRDVAQGRGHQHELRVRQLQRGTCHAQPRSGSP
jgi:hypothetical protein